MLDKKQNEILEMFKEFEQVSHWQNKFEKFLAARVELDNFSKKNTDKGDWVSAVRKTYARALLKGLPNSIKEILFSEVDSDKKKVGEFMDSRKGLIDQDYFKNIVDEELKILRGNIQG